MKSSRHFTLDYSRLIRKMKSARSSITAESFKPQMESFVSKSLATAIRQTPERSLQTIRKNQKKQYDNRVNYIPSIHWKSDPRLIVKKGKHLFYSGGKWYFPLSRRLPDSLWSIYRGLVDEHERRKQTSKAEFVNQRAQARFLWAQSWLHVGLSIGLNIRAAARIVSSMTRRKPPIEPEKGKAHWRGGKSRLTLTILNPFIDLPSKFKAFSEDGSAILHAAIEKHRNQFNREVKRRFIALLKKEF